MLSISDPQYHKNNDRKEKVRKREMEKGGRGEKEEIRTDLRPS